MRRILVILGGLAGALLLVVSPTIAGKGGGKPGGGDPPPDPDPAIVYSEKLGAGDWYLSVANADGSNTTRIVHGTYAGGSDWSPDGTQICFILGDSRYAGPEEGLYVVNRDGTGLRLVVSAASMSASAVWCAGWCPVAASDGEYKIAFGASFPGGDPWPQEIFLVNPDGSGLLNLSNSPTLYEAALSWSPEGRRLAVEAPSPSRTGADLHIYYLDDAGTALVGSECLTDAGPLANRDVRRPRWAKTKDEIVVTVGDSHLWVLQVSDPYSPREITSKPDYSSSAAAEWSEDDVCLLYGRTDRPGGEAWLMAADGSDAPGEALLRRMAGHLAWRR